MEGRWIISDFLTTYQNKGYYDTDWRNLQKIRPNRQRRERRNNGDWKVQSDTKKCRHKRRSYGASRKVVPPIVGWLIKADGGTDKARERRIGRTSKAVRMTKRIVRKKRISKGKELKIYETMIQEISLSGSEYWTLKTRLHVEANSYIIMYKSYMWLQEYEDGIK